MKLSRFSDKNILFIFIDLQKKLLDKIGASRRLVDNNILLLKAAEALQIPCLVTSQYRKGLGEIDPFFASNYAGEVFDKRAFSCVADTPIRERIQSFENEWVIVSGIETHICVLQTALDLLRNGQNVAFVADATGARGDLDHQAGLERMERSGAMKVTTEMLIYELLGSSDSENFKKILPLIKERG